MVIMKIGEIILMAIFAPFLLVLQVLFPSKKKQ